MPNAGLSRLSTKKKCYIMKSPHHCGEIAHHCVWLLESESNRQPPESKSGALNPFALSSSTRVFPRCHRCRELPYMIMSPRLSPAHDGRIITEASRRAIFTATPPASRSVSGPDSGERLPTTVAPDGTGNGTGTTCAPSSGRLGTRNTGQGKPGWFWLELKTVSIFLYGTCTRPHAFFVRK